MNELIAVTPDDAAILELLATDLNLAEYALLWKNNRFYRIKASELFAAADRVVPRGYIDGLILSNSAGDVDHDISIATGTARDSTDAYTLTLAAALIKQLDAAWAAGTNAGGLDTGSIGASAVYYVWLIRKDSDASIDALFSLSATAPTMPAGYTYKRRIGTVLTDAASKIINFIQKDDRFIYNQPIQNRATASVANTNRNAYAASAPPGMFAILLFDYSSGAVSTDVFAWFGSSAHIDSAASSSNYDTKTYIQNDHGILRMEIILNSSSQFYARASSTSFAFGSVIHGWIDDRGRNA